MDETTVLLAVRDVLRDDAQSGGLLFAEGVRFVEISEGGDIDAGTPTPCVIVDGQGVTYTPRTMTGADRRAVMEVVIHVYLDLTDRSGPEPGALCLKRICRRVETLLQRNTLNLGMLPPQTGKLVYPPYGQRNYVDRREGRVPVTYRWVDYLS